MRRGLVLTGVLGVSASIALACTSFGTDGGSSATADGGEASSSADGGETCAIAVDETFDNGPGQLPQSRAGAGNAVSVDGGVLVATVGRQSASGEAQLFNSAQGLTGTFSRSRLTFTIEDLRPASTADYIRVGCTLKLRVNPTNDLDLSEVFLRVNGSQLGLGGFDVVDGGAGASRSMNLLSIPATGTTVSATLDTVAGGPNLVTTAGVADAGAPAIVKSNWADGRAWQLKCGIDDSSMEADAGDPQYTVRVTEVKLEICTR